MPVQIGSSDYLAVAAPFVGQASRQHAHYVLMTGKAPASHLFALLERTTAEDLGWARVPWLRLAAVIIVVLAFGLWLPRYEIDRPIRRLRLEIQKVARGKQSTVSDSQVRGVCGAIARDINAAIERFVDRPRAPSLPNLPRRLAEGLEALSRPRLTETIEPEFLAPSPADEQRLAPSVNPFLAAVSPVPPPRPPSLQSAVEKLSSKSSWLTDQENEKTPPSGRMIMLAKEERAHAASNSQRLAKVIASANSNMLDNTHADSSLDPLEEMPNEEKTRAVSSVALEDSHVKEVFDAYVAARTKTGEVTASLNIDSFRAKLEGTTREMIAKYGCRTARFAVTIREGKTTIKATAES
jgi:hypothetical protein